MCLTGLRKSCFRRLGRGADQRQLGHAHGDERFDGQRVGHRIDGNRLLSGATLSEAQLQTLVDALTYRNTSDNPTTAGNRVVTITGITDSGGTAAARKAQPRI
jgi:hypothetical protein